MEQGAWGTWDLTPHPRVGLLSAGSPNPWRLGCRAHGPGGSFNRPCRLLGREGQSLGTFQRTNGPPRAFQASAPLRPPAKDILTEARSGRGPRGLRPHHPLRGPSTHQVLQSTLMVSPGLYAASLCRQGQSSSATQPPLPSANSPAGQTQPDTQRVLNCGQADVHQRLVRLGSGTPRGRGRCPPPLAPGSTAVPSQLTHTVHIQHVAAPHTLGPLRVRGGVATVQEQHGGHAP